MYEYIYGAILAVISICIGIHLWRKRNSLRRLHAMSDREKNELLDSLAEPFGYRYVPEWDTFSSRVDAWQKQFGYGAIYDRAASYFHMVLETLPVYFNYDGKTWLIQIWKGQYGICTGCEVGIYHADRIVAKENRATTIFHVVDEEEMLLISTELRREGQLIAFRRETHWWLTTFDVGTFSEPEQLSLKIAIHFFNPEMQAAFYMGLLEQGVDWNDIFTRFYTVYFYISEGVAEPSRWKRVQSALAQWLNRFNCKLFCFVTRFCVSSRDRILYLYFYLPFVYRHVLCFRRAPGKRR